MTTCRPVPIEPLLAEVLSRNPATHSAYLLYRLLARNIVSGRGDQTQSELADRLGLSTKSVARALQTLRTLGAVIEQPDGSRVHRIPVQMTWDPDVVAHLKHRLGEVSDGN